MEYTGEPFPGRYQRLPHDGFELSYFFSERQGGLAPVPSKEEYAATHDV